MIGLSEAEITKDWKKEYGKDAVVDILCGAYNQELYIGQTLDSFLMQKTDFPFRIIIHDDASTDGTMEIIKEYERRFPNLIYAMYENENLYSKEYGRLAGKMYGTVSAEYLALCDGDDYWTDKGKLQKQYDFLRRNPDYSMCFHPVYYLANDKYIKDDRHYKKECTIPTTEIIERGGMYCATCSLFCRVSAKRDVPGWVKMSDVGDYPIQILLSLRGKVWYLPEIMGVYRYNALGSWSNAVKLDKKKEIAHCRTQIRWMKELDRDTSGTYRDSIYRHMVGSFYFKLLSMGEVSIKTVLNNIKMMSSKPEKMKLNANAVNVLIRKMVREYLPGVHILYKKMMSG